MMTKMIIVIITTQTTTMVETTVTIITQEEPAQTIAQEEKTPADIATTTMGTVDVTQDMYPFNNDAKQRKIILFHNEATTATITAATTMTTMPITM